MKQVPLIVTLLFLAACDNMGSNTNYVVDSSAGVHLIPFDSAKQAMPVQPTDTNGTAMPTVYPDTSRVQPK